MAGELTDKLVEPADKPPSAVAAACRAKNPEDCEGDGSNPLSEKFWKYHVGTDLLVASWLFLASAILFVAMEVDLILENPYASTDLKFQYWSAFASAALFLVGSVFFVWLSYPSEQAKMHKIVALEDMSELTFTEKYFTGTDMLIATWCFLLCATPVLAYALFTIIVLPHSWVGYFFMLGCLGYFLVVGVWVVGSMPINMQMNEGRGSSYFFDLFFKPVMMDFCCCCCCKDEAFWRRHVGSDALAGSWLFFLCALALIPYSLYFAIFEPKEMYSWLTVGSIAGFVFGAGLITYVTYPENDGSRLVWNFLTCDRSHLIDL